MSKNEITISALMLAMIAAANARADTVSPPSPDAVATYDYATDKARANYETARDCCAEVEGSQATCETRARASYKAQLAAAHLRYVAEAQHQATSPDGAAR